MRLPVIMAVSLLVVACKTGNGDFDPGADGGTQGSTSATGATVPTTSVGSTGVGEGSGGETEGMVDVPCDADLYAVNELGDLVLIDVDSGQTETIEMGNQFIESWAIAADPNEDVVYISPINNPTTLRTLDPLTLELADMGIAIGDQVMGIVARADFDPDGVLWLGTDATSRFISYDTTTEMAGAGVMFNSGVGGDMVFLDLDLALVIDNAGLAHLIDFEAAAVDPIVLVGITGLVTGLAIDLEDRLWVSTFDGNITLVDVVWDGALPDLYAAESVQVDVDINDLAPVYTHPAECD